MHLQYRYLAQEALANATRLLNSNDDGNLIYACLELRKAIEGYAYELLRGYLSEVPLKAFEVWQPDKVIKELLHIDPSADKSSRVTMQRAASNGEPAGKWQELGEDRRLNAQRMSRMYHQLGNFLHVPMIRQAQEGGFNNDIIRERATSIKSELAHVLGATIWNVNFSENITINCTECETPIKRRKSVLESAKHIECGGCGQKFSVEPEANGKDVLFEPMALSWDCKVCEEPRQIPDSRAKDGLDVDCPKCGDRAKLVFVQTWKLLRRVENSEDAIW